MSMNSIKHYILLLILLLQLPPITDAQIDSTRFSKLTFSPMKFLIGDFGGQYETRLADRICLDAGLGVTYPFKYVDALYDRFSRKFEERPGISGQLILRYYFVDDPVRSGFALEGMVRYVRYHGKPIVSDFTFQSDLSDRWYVSSLSHFSINLSYQFVTQSSWIFRPYVGIGVLDKTEYATFEEKAGTIDAATSSASVNTEHRRIKYNQMLPSIKFGVDIGILRFKKKKEHQKNEEKL